MPKMSHPNLPGQIIDAGARAARTYARSGWEPFTAETLASSHTRDELDDLAADLEVDPAGYRTKADLAEAITDED